MTNNRLNAIDLLRGLTMILMVFVNDLWSLKNIPQWMLHVAPNADGIGLSDIVFPAFLFIVGLSLPLAIDARRDKGHAPAAIARHVITRSIALVIMGLFLVNGEYMNMTATGMSRHAWYVACCISFILIWNAYPPKLSRTWRRMLQTSGIIMLLILAYICRGGTIDAPTGFQTYWWGILGLIGWAYLTAGLITVASKGRTVAIAASWFFFTVLSMLHHARIIPKFLYALPEPVIGGTMTALVLGGVWTMHVFRKYTNENQSGKMTATITAAIAVLCALSAITRPLWGLSKQAATPAWLFLCSAFTLAGLLIIYWVSDRAGKAEWLSFARPAGRDTLLTYLMPFFVYALTVVSGLHLPEFILTGGVGLLKSMSFAMLCVWLTSILSGAGIKLKL